MAVTDEMLDIAEKYAPSDCCLVPEKREELTTEGGLDVVSQQERISDACQRLAAANIRVSLFIDAEPEQIEAAKACNAPVIEIHTGRFADAKTEYERHCELGRIIRGVQLGHELGLQVNAGHGLNYHNTRAIATIPEIVELNIGHAIIARALFDGMENAVSLMKKIMVEARK
jgi:pyridoxine 5-phosphate synthase